MKNMLMILVFFSMAIIYSCKKDKNPDPTGAEPITLACDYFNQSRVLKNYPDKPVDYIINCGMAITADVVIEPGVVIQFTNDAGLVIESDGSLSAAGTAGNPIQFTSKNKLAGAWKGIHFYSTNPANKIDHSIIEYAGAGSDGASIWIGGKAKISITNSTIKNSSNYGIKVPNKNNGSQITLNGNKITSSELAPLFLNGDYIGVPSPTDDYTGNGEDRIILELYTSGIHTPTTWRKINVPYKVMFVAAGGLGINSDVVVEPGVQIYFSSGSFIGVGEGHSFRAIGTPAERILFSGVTNQSGSWGGISYSGLGNNPLNEIGYADFHNAGDLSLPGAIYMWADPVLKFHNVTFNNLDCAFYQPLGNQDNPNLTRTNITYNNVATEYCYN